MSLPQTGTGNRVGNSGGGGGGGKTGRDIRVTSSADVGISGARCRTANCFFINRWISWSTSPSTMSLTSTFNQ